MILCLFCICFIFLGVVTYYGRDTQGNMQSDLSVSGVNDSKALQGIYIMRTSNQLCCELTDTKGTHFNVMSNGQIAIENTQTIPVTKETNSNPNEVGSKKEVLFETGPIQSAPVSPLVPRFFIIHADGTGSELLRHADVKEFLDHAEEDPATAVLKSPFDGDLDVIGLTIIKPYEGNCKELCSLFSKFAQNNPDKLASAIKIISTLKGRRLTQRMNCQTTQLGLRRGIE